MYINSLCELFVEKKLFPIVKQETKNCHFLKYLNTFLEPLGKRPEALADGTPYAPSQQLGEHTYQLVFFFPRIATNNFYFMRGSKKPFSHNTSSHRERRTSPSTREQAGHFLPTGCFTWSRILSDLSTQIMKISSKFKAD